jgi:hypothetical protein
MGPQGSCHRQAKWAWPGLRFATIVLTILGLVASCTHEADQSEEMAVAVEFEQAFTSGGLAQAASLVESTDPTVVAIKDDELKTNYLDTS